MDCRELEQNIADYAMGTLTEETRIAFERSLPACPEVADDYATLWQPVIALLPFSVAATDPDPALRARVLAFATGETASPTRPVVTMPASNGHLPSASHRLNDGAISSYQPVQTTPSLPQSRGLAAIFNSPRLAWAAVIALLLINLASVGWSINLNGQLNEQMQQVKVAQQETAQAKAEIDQMLAERDLQTMALKSDPMKAPNTVVRAYFVPGKNALYVTMQGWQAPADGGNCEVWLEGPDGFVNLGPLELTDKSGGSLMTHPGGEVSSYKAIMLTWEQPGQKAKPSEMVIAEASMVN